MKKLIQHLLIGTLLCVPVFAHETGTSNSKPDYKNELMAFVLEKGKQYSEKAEIAISKGVDIAMQETPLIIKEFLTWRLWQHGIYGFGSLLFILLVLYFVTIPCVRGLIKGVNEDDLNPLCLLGAILSFAIITLAFFVLVIPNTFSFIKIWIAPRIYLVEEITKLIQ